MNGLKQWNEALLYMEEHLKEEPDYTEIARKAGCSEFHFQRMFSFLSGINLSDYLRNRKMTMAAVELTQTEIKIIDLALDYGYSTPEAFTRAFKSVHKKSPREVRNSKQFKVFPKLTFHLTMEGAEEMNVKEENKEAFTMYGVERIISLKDGKNFEEIPKFWDEFYSTGMDKKLPTAPMEDHHAIMCYDVMDDEKMDYMICTVKREGCDTTGFKEISIPAAEWAIFTTEEVPYGKITEPLQALWKKIFPEWFPVSGYEHAPLPECEFYLKTDHNTEYAQIWIPVQKPSTK